MFKKEIKRGVKWLDENIPGWLDKIDLEKMDMVSLISQGCRRS